MYTQHKGSRGFNDDSQNLNFCRLQLVVETFNMQRNEPTNQNSIEVLINVKPTNKKPLS